MSWYDNCNQLCKINQVIHFQNKIATIISYLHIVYKKFALAHQNSLRFTRYNNFSTRSKRNALSVDIWRANFICSYNTFNGGYSISKKEKRSKKESNPSYLSWCTKESKQPKQKKKLFFSPKFNHNQKQKWWGRQAPIGP